MHNSNNIAPPCDRGLTPSPWAGSPGRPPCASRTSRSCKSHRHPPWSPVLPHLFNTTINIPPMEDDVAPNAVVEEGSDHVKEDVEDPGAFKMFNPVL